MALAHKLNVDLGERSYPIYIGSGLLDEPELLIDHVSGSSALIVSNTAVAPLYLQSVQQTLDTHNIRQDSVILEDGEQYKPSPR